MVEECHSITIGDHEVTLRLNEKGELLNLALLARLKIARHPGGPREEREGGDGFRSAEQKLMKP